MISYAILMAALMPGQPTPLPDGGSPSLNFPGQRGEGLPPGTLPPPPDWSGGPPVVRPVSSTQPATAPPGGALLSPGAPASGSGSPLDLPPSLQIAVRANQAPAAVEAVPEPMAITAPLLPVPLPTLAAPLTPAATAVVPDRWWVMRELQGTWLGAFLDNNRMYISGWLEQSYTASTSPGPSNVTVVWNDRANEYLFQQGWIRFGRSVVTAGTTQPTFGFQVDILTGSDYRFSIPRGLLNSQLNNVTGAQNLYGVDLIQHYVNMYIPTMFRGTEFRFGRLYTPWGVESLEAVSTPLLSRSYAFNWSPPFTHCGLGMYSTITQEWSTVLMLVNGNDVYFGDPSEELRFVGNVKWTQPGGRNTVTLATSLGRGKFNPAYPTPPYQTTVALATEPYGRNNFNAFDIVYTHAFSSVLSYNMEGIYGYQYNVPAAAMSSPPANGSNGFANWFSVAHYLFYTYSPKVGAILRFENFDDFQGQRTGYSGLFTAVTGGVQYRINKSMIVRPELRYDYNGQSTPYYGDHGLFTAAADLIIRW